MDFPSIRSLIPHLAFLVQTTSASTILDTLDAKLYRDEAALYPMVGKVNGSGFNGSGVFLSGRWVLTAGHVADFKTGGTFSEGGKSYTIESVFTHPSHAIFSTSYDVGLLYLSTEAVGIETASLYRFPQPEQLLGREAVWVGHGLGGTGTSGAQSPLDTRAFTNVIDGFTPRAGLPQPSFFADFDNPSGTGNSLNSDPNPTRLEGNVTSGDSGGGVFIEIGGISYLVGINSYTSGFSPGLNSKYGSLSGAANLHYFHDWIFEKTGITAVPEPSSTAVIVMLSVIALGMSRRRDPR